MKRIKSLFVVGAAILSMTLASVTLPSTADARGGRGGGHGMHMGGGARVGDARMGRGRMAGARAGGLRARRGGLGRGRGGFGRGGRGFGRHGFARGGYGRGFRGGRYGFRLGLGRRFGYGIRVCPRGFRFIRGRCRLVY